MILGKKTAVIIPAYNEQDFIVKTIKGVPAEIDVIVCVDDRSTDATHAVMLARAQKEKRVIVMQTDQNGGIGHAVRTGFSRVIDEVDYVAVLPGDDQCDASLIPKFVQMCEREGYHCVKGNRFMSGNDTTAMPQNRKIGNIVYSMLTKMVSGYYTLFDSQHGFCVIQTTVLKRVAMKSIRRDYLFDNSLWIVLNTVNARIGEMRSPVRYQGEISDVNYVRFVQASIQYFAIAFVWRLFKRYGHIHPVTVALLMSAVLLIYSLWFHNGLLFLYGTIIGMWMFFFDYWCDPNAVYQRLRK